MTKFPIYQIGHYHVFRGKIDKKSWFVFDTKLEQYVGGSFDTQIAAKEYAEDRLGNNS